MSVTEKHRAIVTRITDEDIGLRLRGAVFFNAPTLYKGEYPLPAEPCFPFASANGAGMFWVPQVGDEIEVEIQADDGGDDTTDVELPEPTYVCMLYSDADDADIDDIFKANYGKSMGWKSNSGHYFIFDDTEDKQFYKMVSGKGHSLIFDDKKEGQLIKMQSILGHILLFDDKNKIVKMLHSGGGKLEINETQVTLVDVSGDQKIVLEAGKINAKATAEIILDAPIAKIGTSPSFHATLSENMIGLHDQHIHLVPQSQAGINPSQAPIVPMSSKAGTPLDPTALSIFLKGNT
jgi:hypothetical protein